MKRRNRFVRDSQSCKFCGAELSDYRKFCDNFCQSDFEGTKADNNRDADR